MRNKSYLTIKLSEDGRIIETKVRGKVVEPSSKSLLDQPLRLRDLASSPSGRQDDITIGEFKTIILIKLIRSSDGSYTWFVKDPPEPSIAAISEQSSKETLRESTVAIGLGCPYPPRCHFRCIRLDQNDLWIQPPNAPQGTNPARVAETLPGEQNPPATDPVDYK